MTKTISLITVLLCSVLITNAQTASTTYKKASDSYSVIEVKTTDSFSSTLASSTEKRITGKAKINTFTGKFGRRVENGDSVFLSWNTKGVNSCDLFWVKDNTKKPKTRELIFSNLKPDGKITTNFRETKVNSDKEVSIFQLDCYVTSEKSTLRKTVKFEREEKGVKDSE